MLFRDLRPYRANVWLLLISLLPSNCYRIPSLGKRFIRLVLTSIKNVYCVYT